MENYYEVLNCAPDASFDELKTSYQTLVRIHHPDKIIQRGCSKSDIQQHSALFLKIDQAWKVLSDEELRKEYDAKWQQRCLAQKWPIQDDVELSDFYPEEDYFCYDCRCGGQYVLTETDVSFKVDIVSCALCSLCVQVSYSDTEVIEHSRKDER